MERKARLWHRRKKSAVACLTAVVVGAGVGMIMKSFCGGVLNQYKARENDEDQDHPPF
jgi:hypothetical protein